MAEVIYQQVAFKKGNSAEDIRWIPAKLAVKGSYRKRKIDGEWSDGWLITEVYATQVNESAVLDMRDRSKHHREGTDI